MFQFGSICPLEHLLAHMDDSPHVAKRLCALLMEAFRPSQQCSEQLIRCMELLEFSIPAARKFYQLVAEHMPVNDVGEPRTASTIHVCSYSCDSGM